MQLYVEFPAAAEESPNQLKGFTKVVLAPAATQRVTMRLDRSSLSAWDAETSQSLVHPGTYTVRVVPVTGISATKPTGNLLTITLAAGQNSIGNLFGEKAA